MIYLRDLRRLRTAHAALVNAGETDRSQLLSEWHATYEAVRDDADMWHTTCVVHDGVVHAHLTSENFDPGLPYYALCGTELAANGAITEWDETFPGETIDADRCSTCVAYDPTGTGSADPPSS